MPDRPLVDRDPAQGRDSALIALSYLVSSLSGAGVALLLGFVHGSSATTDAVLAAYSIYTVVVLLAPVARTALVPLYGTTGDEARFRAAGAEVGGRAAALGIAAGVAVVVLSPALGIALTASRGAHAHVLAIVTLVILAPAIALQFFAAAESALLGAARRFGPTARAYTLGAVLTFVAAVPLVLTIGALGAPVAILVGAASIAALHDRALAPYAARVRPRVTDLLRRDGWGLAGALLSAAALAGALQAQLAIAVADVSSAAGDVTRYTYAFFAVMTVVSVTSGTASLVALPDLVQRLGDRDEHAIRAYLAASGPPVFAIVVPVCATVAAFGRPLLGLVFGSTFTGSQIDQLFDLLLILLPLALAFSVLLLVQAVGVATGRQRTFVAAALATVTVTIAGALGWRGDTEAVAAVHAVAGVLMTVIAARLVLGAHAGRLTGEMLRRCAPALALALPFVAGGLLVGRHASAAVAAVAALTCVALYGLAGARLWPRVVGAFPGLRRLAPQPPPA